MSFNFNTDAFVDANMVIVAFVCILFLCTENLFQSPYSINKLFTPKIILSSYISYINHLHFIFKKNYSM